MGLLGESFDDPKTMAILSLAGGLMSGGNSGQAMQKGLLGYQQVMQAANEQKRQAAMDKMAQDEFGMKQREFGMREAAFQAQQQALVERQRHLQTLRGAMVNGDISGNELLQLGIPADLIKEALSVRDMGRPEVARTIEVEGPNGQKLIKSVDKFGREVGPAVEGYTAPVNMNLGDRMVMVKPQAGMQLPMGTSPDASASNAVAWANNAIAQQRLEFDMAGGKDAVNGAKPQFKDGNWVMPPKAMKPGTSIPAVPSATIKDAREALAIIEQAKEVIPKATGSYFGSGIDQGLRVFGLSTQGDLATGQLQALEGALVAKMPKMSGPQSDKDVALYRQMAGVIGDPTIPQERKLAALQTVEEIQRRYAGLPITPPKLGGQPIAPPKMGALGSGAFKILSVEE